MKPDPVSHKMHTNQFQVMKDLDAKRKRRKILEDTVWEYLYDIEIIKTSLSKKQNVHP